MKYKIEYNRKECIGCGACASQCPENWELEEKGEEVKAKPKKTELEEVGANQEAADICPVGAIKIKKVK